MRAFSIHRRWSSVIGIACLAVVPAFVSAQTVSRVQAQATPEDVLAALVHRSAVIFAGEVYAIRVPAGMSAPVGGGLPSARPDAVVIEFRVDVGVRGASIGSNYLLRMPLSVWQQAPPYTLHEHALTFLLPADAAGLSGPVEGEADLPGMALGVIPVDRANQADLSRLQRLVTKKTMVAANAPPPADASNPLTPKPPPTVSDVTTQAGEDTLISGSNQGRMPELRNNEVPFLALIRDVSVLSAAESPQETSAGATK